MANTLTNLIPVLFDAADRVSKFRISHVNRVARNSKLEMAGLNQTVTVPITPTPVVNNLTPSMTIPEGDNQTISSVNMTLDKAKSVQIPWEGEEQYSYGTNGTLDETLVQQFENSFVAMNGLVETDIAALYKKASRAYGTSGSTPFASSLKDAAQVKKILKDNGAPGSPHSLILDSDGIANLTTLANINTDYSYGGTEPLRTGEIPAPLYGFVIGESHYTASHTKGDGANYLIDNGAGYAVGTTTIHVDTGTGAFLAGDYITIGSDTNKYLITTGFAGDGDGDIVIAEPGLKVAAIDDAAVTIGDSYTANMAYSSNAIQLATRPPKSPIGPDGRPRDAALDKMLFTDPNSGITYLISMFGGFHKMMIEISLVWGVEMIKPEHAAILLG